jgi:hypothetical protein
MRSDFRATGKEVKYTKKQKLPLTNNDLASESACHVQMQTGAI